MDEAKPQSAEEFVRMLLWDDFPECCGSPVVGAEYMGQQEMVCCGCPEPALLSDAQIVAALRERFPESAAPLPQGVAQSADDPLDKMRRCSLGCAEYGQCKAAMHGVPSECPSPSSVQPTVTDEPQDCPVCSNAYLAIRTDLYKDGREFVYCDCCGCLADRRVWNRITPLGVAIPQKDQP